MIVIHPLLSNEAKCIADMIEISHLASKQNFKSDTSSGGKLIKLLLYKSLNSQQVVLCSNSHKEAFVS